VQVAVDSLKYGALDYVVKGMQFVDRLAAMFAKIGQVHKPLLGFYNCNASFMAPLLVENSVRFYVDYVLYGLLYAYVRHHLLTERRRRETEQSNTSPELAFLRSQLCPNVKIAPRAAAGRREASNGGRRGSGLTELQARPANKTLQAE
jgi:hypothetical protein